jgi:2-polyprenyl-6-hydroxyphenyl methylase/3-demethylubiquinone-9 3-methyltransferase
MSDNFIGKDVFHQHHKEWWDENGVFSVLHNLNRVRIPYIMEKIRQVGFNPEQISLLDVGCGGGIVSCKLSQMGVLNITAIDSLVENIEIAKNYSEKNNINVNFVHKSVEDLISSEIRYDIVICLEVIEHVEDYHSFLNNLSKLVKKDGLLIISTISKNIWSYFSMIICAEFLLQIVPKGTHSWSKFINSEDLFNHLVDFDLINISGIKYNPFFKKFSISSKICDNYIASFAKK